MSSISNFLNYRPFCPICNLEMKFELSASEWGGNSTMEFVIKELTDKYLYLTTTSMYLDMESKPSLFEDTFDFVINLENQDLISSNINLSNFKYKFKMECKNTVKSLNVLAKNNFRSFKDISHYLYYTDDIRVIRIESKKFEDIFIKCETVILDEYLFSTDYFKNRSFISLPLQSDNFMQATGFSFDKGFNIAGISFDKLPLNDLNKLKQKFNNILLLG